MSPDTNICPHTEPYVPGRLANQQDPYDTISKARTARTERFWQTIIQKGRMCQLAGVFCSEYDLPDWQKYPILKRFNSLTKMGSPDVEEANEYEAGTTQGSAN
jgi:hypothetical protein